MAQNIKLKRSSVAGKVPTVAQLEAGELAINTADGKLYFERDDSTIQSIVTTNAVITGSVNINGPITGSDVRINQWGSVSASLSAIQSGANNLTLQQVTDQGNTTTNSITAPSFTGSLFGTASYATQSLSSSYALTASYALQALSSSYAAVATSASFATSAALVEFANVANKPTLVSSSAQIDLSQATGTAANAVSASYAAFATTASYALKAESVGQLNQNVTIAGNLNVFGTASFTYTTASQLNVEEAFISVNVATPAQRFGGLVVYDSGSVNVTASLAYDSLNNDWKFFHEDVSTADYSVLIFGPLGTDKENTPKLTGNWITKAQNDSHGHHIGTSSLFDDGTVVKSTVPVQVTGSLSATGKVSIGTVDNYGTDPDKFLAIVNGEVVYRTGAQVLSDIGGQTSGTFVQNSGAGGTARYIMRYADSNSATTSSIYEDTSGNIGIKKTTPGAPLDVNGSAIISGSLTVTGTTAVVQQGIQVSGVGSLAIASISTTTYRGAFLDYVLSSDDQVNRRAGTLTLVWTASDIEWKDTSTMDIGNTDGAEFAPTNSGGNANIVLSLPGGDWTVRGHLRYM
jgi:hypothetical protein